MRRLATPLMLLFTAAARAAAPAGAAIVPSDARVESVARIWDAAPHNAFTDLVRFDGAFYATFREASRHGVPALDHAGGKIRVLRSADGVAWSSGALLSTGATNHDLRDPKLTATPGGRLMLLATDVPHAGSGGTRQSLVWFSNNGTTFTAPQAALADSRWMWRAEWSPRDGRAYGISYTNNLTRLHAGADGQGFTDAVPTLSRGNEAGLVFRADGSAVALVRRDDAATSMVGVSTIDGYTAWSWRNTGVFIGGPDLIELPDGRIIAGGRFTDGADRTSLAVLDPVAGTLAEILTLPSGGDTSYPGLVWHDDKLFVSYYSSHEGGKSRIYLATVTFSDVPEPASLAIVAAGGLAMGLRRPSPSPAGAKP